jgi:glyoxylase-like metal-dependent hydrolase (beta-lactamase superfamily II)
MRMEWTVGDVRIVKVVEREMPVPLDGFLQSPPDGIVDRHPWLRPDFVTPDGQAVLSIHGLVVDTGERRMLVDTCIGEHEMAPLPRVDSPFLDRLADAGYGVDDIDTVICTHLHFDHVGWNTRLVDGEWVVTFPAARYLFARPEWEHWSVTEHDYTNVGETVRPVLDAGQADLVAVDHRVSEHVRLEPTPGHTPGHVSVVIESAGERAVITGDMAHHPLQFADPDLSMPADSDQAQAAATRRRFLAERAADGALVIGTHFAGATAGRIVADGDGDGWILETQTVTQERA